MRLLVMVPKASKILLPNLETFHGMVLQMLLVKSYPAFPDTYKSDKVRIWQQLKVHFLQG